MPEFQSPLSPAGQHRRERILDLALAQARRRRRRRLAGRTTLAVLLAAGLAAPFLRSRPAQPPHSQVAIKPPQSHPPIPAAPLPQPTDALVVTRIDTDPHIIERLAIRPQPPHVIVINDNELLNDLALAHRPAGLAYVDGKAMLLFR